MKTTQNKEGNGLNLTWSGDTQNLAWDISGGGNVTEYETEENTSTVTVTSTAKELRTIVANWYNILRDIALVALLSVLVFIGIKNINI